MSRLSKQVREFTAAIGHASRVIPAVPPEDEVRLRMQLIAEEFFELVDATFDCPSEDMTWYVRSRDYIKNAINGKYPFHRLPVKVDLPECADALADLAYVVEGLNACCGIDSEHVLEEVHRANMAKVIGGYQDETGKWRKPEGWTPPDIALVLRMQGWEP